MYSIFFRKIWKDKRCQRILSFVETLVNYEKIEILFLQKINGYKMSSNPIIDGDCDDGKRCKNIIERAFVELHNMTDNWCNNCDDNFSGGKMRSDRGDDIENFTRNIINMFRDIYNVNVRAVKGSDDKKKLLLQHKDRTIVKDHQVDIHIYKDDNFIAVIECKAYLDSCYYVRACDDFKLFKKFGYDIKSYIFALENSINENTKVFTDVITDYVCDDIFYMLDGKRKSDKPIYDKKHKKPLNKEKLTYFITVLHKLLIDQK